MDRSRRALLKYGGVSAAWAAVGGCATATGIDPILDFKTVGEKGIYAGKIIDELKRTQAA
jgi:hypothetical protein